MYWSWSGPKKQVTRGAMYEGSKRGSGTPPVCVAFMTLTVRHLDELPQRFVSGVWPYVYI